jgi:hypothetical protein
MKRFRLFDRSIFPIGFVCDEPFEESDNEYAVFACCVGPVIFYSDLFKKLDSDSQRFILMHEICHVKQFYFTFGLNLLCSIIGIKKVYDLFEKKADEYAEKKTGLKASKIRTNLENFLKNEYLSI